MKLKFLKTTLAGLVFAVSGLVNAGFTDTTHNSFIDETTKLEWMDFGINNGKSYNYVVSQLGSGGLYAGWRLPTKDEVLIMWKHAFLDLGANIEEPNMYGKEQGLVADGKNKTGSVFKTLYATIGWNTIVAFRTDRENAFYYGLYASSKGLSYISGVQRRGKVTDIENNDINVFHDDANMDIYLNKGHRAWSTLLVKDFVNVIEATPDN